MFLNKMEQSCLVGADRGDGPTTNTKIERKNVRYIMKICHLVIP